MAMTKQLWSLNALATELDHDRRTVANALKTVPPDGQLAGHPAWFLATAIKALRPQGRDGDAIDPVRERARKDRALAVASEIKNDIAQGRVVLVEDVERTMIKVILSTRTRLLALPSKTAGRVPGDVRDGVQSVVQSEVYDALTELSQTQVVAEGEAPGTRSRRAAA